MVYKEEQTWIVLHYVVYDIYSNQLTVNHNQLTSEQLPIMKQELKTELLGTDHNTFSPIAQLVRALH